MSSTNKTFSCTFESCEYATANYLKFLTHTWDKHELNSQFSYCCKKYRLYIRNFKSHSWFYYEHVKCRKKESNTLNTVYENVDLDENQEMESEKDIASEKSDFKT